MGIPMIAKASCRYGTRRLVAGDEFTVAGKSEATLYKALKWADEKPAQAPAVAVEPAQPTQPSWGGYAAKKVAAKKTAAKKTSGGYLTRNLTSDDDAGGSDS